MATCVPVIGTGGSGLRASIELAERGIDVLAVTSSGRGSHTVRYLQRSVRSILTEHTGVDRDDAGLRAGLRELDDVESQLTDMAAHPDIAGFHDLAHAFDLRSGILAAHATLEAALERRGTRGCHNRSDYPDVDESLPVNLVWSGPGKLAREPLPDIPQDVSALIREVSSHGKLVE